MSYGKTRKPLAMTDYLYSKATRLNLPLSGTFELTPMCNFACKMCYVRKTAAEVKASSRSMRTLEDWTLIAEEACKEGLLYVLLTGGEPTTWPDFWTLYERLTQMGILVAVNTNGSLLNAEAIARFVKNPPKRISITLYGACDETYERLCGVKGMFTRVWNNILEIKKAGIQIKLNCSLTPFNIGDLEEMVRLSKEHQLILDTTTYMFPPIRRDESRIGENERFTPEEAARFRMKAYKLQYGEEAYERFLQNIQKGIIIPPGLEDQCVDPIDGRIRCKAGRASFWYTWDGFMSPCGMMTRPYVDMEGKSFAEGWSELVDTCKEIRLSGVCASCNNLKLCHSCAAMALAETGEVSGIPNYLCQMVDAMKTLADEEIELKK